MSARINWLWLATRPGVSARVCGVLLDAFGTPDSLYAADRKTLESAPGLRREQLDALCDKSTVEAERIAADCQRRGIQIVTRDDSGYPACLRNIADPPTVLYVRGTLPDLDAAPGIAVVGTRRATAYGIAVAERLGKRLAEAGLVVVSGLAAGIDGAAARGALRADGGTVAVLGCGVDRCYPASHVRLMGDVLLAGAVVSEYPPGEPPLAVHFPVRNRIISGLSAATVVVEAPRRSGALITAHLALDQGRDVYAVPGNLDAPNSRGTNRLIADGEAALLCTADDLIAQFGSQQAPPEPVPARRTAPVTPAEPSHPVYQTPLPKDGEDARIVRAVTEGAGTVDEIAQQTALPAAQIAAALTMLELDGVLERQEGRLRLCRGRG